MSTTNESQQNPTDPRAAYAAAVAGLRPVDPFALSCRFDRARGEFVVRAGARTGAVAATFAALLMLGTAAFLEKTFAPAPVIVAIDPPPAPAPAVAVASVASANTPAIATTKTPSAAAVAKELPPRTPGLNYLVLRSAPTKREAESACERLKDRGVAATVEEGLPGWSKTSTFTVVGLTGFDLRREPEQFDRHVKDLKDLKGLKLNPRPYKWRGTEVADAGR